MCRTPIEKEKTVKKVLQAKVAEMDDPFAMGGEDKMADDVIVSAPVGGPPEPINPAINDDVMVLPPIQAPDADADATN